MKNDSHTFEKLITIIKCELPAVSLDVANRLASKIQFNFSNQYSANLEQEVQHLRTKVTSLEKRVSGYDWITNPDRMGR